MSYNRPDQLGEIKEHKGHRFKGVNGRITGKLVWKCEFCRQRCVDTRYATEECEGIEDGS